MSRIPKRLQPTLWSQNITSLDIKKDGPYIIHQVLRYGTLEDIMWLKKTYPTRTLRETFLQHPIKVYSASSLNFAKKILLNIGTTHINENKYLAVAPRSSSARSSRAK